MKLGNLVVYNGLFTVTDSRSGWTLRHGYRGNIFVIDNTYQWPYGIVFDDDPEKLPVFLPKEVLQYCN